MSHKIHCQFSRFFNYFSDPRRMSRGGRSTIGRIVLHRSTERLHIQYEDGHREEFFDREIIRWVLLENHSIDSRILF